MPNNPSGSSSPVYVIVGGVIAVVLILTVAYLLMHGTFSMDSNTGVMPSYTPAKSATTGGTSNTSTKSSDKSNSSNSKDSSGSSSSNDSDSNSDSTDSNHDVDLNTSDDEISVDKNGNKIDVNILKKDDNKKQDIDIGL